MKENLKDILGSLNSETDQQTLLNYLQGKLNAEQQHQVEKNMLQNDFEADAMEGLQQFNDKQKMMSLVQQLNMELKKKTARKEKWNQKKKVKLESWLLLAIVLILFLAVISYLVIDKMAK